MQGLALPVDPGDHVFTFVAPGQPMLTRHFVLKEGEKDRRERVVIGPIVAAPAAAPAPATAETAGGLGTQRLLGISAAGLGLVGVALGTIFGVQTFSAVSTQHSDCPSGIARGPPRQRQTTPLPRRPMASSLPRRSSQPARSLQAGRSSSSPRLARARRVATGIVVVPSVGPGGGRMLRGVQNESLLDPSPAGLGSALGGGLIAGSGRTDRRGGGTRRGGGRRRTPRRDTSPAADADTPPGRRRPPGADVWPATGTPGTRSTRTPDRHWSALIVDAATARVVLEAGYVLAERCHRPATPPPVKSAVFDLYGALRRPLGAVWSELGDVLRGRRRAQLRASPATRRADNLLAFRRLAPIAASHDGQIAAGKYRLPGEPPAPISRARPRPSVRGPLACCTHGVRAEPAWPRQTPSCCNA